MIELALFMMVMVIIPSIFGKRRKAADGKEE